MSSPVDVGAAYDPSPTAPEAVGGNPPSTNPEVYRPGPPPTHTTPEDTPRTFQDKIDQLERTAENSGDASFGKAESQIDRLTEQLKSLQQGQGVANFENLRQEDSRLCGHAMFTNPEWTHRGRAVLHMLRHRSERCHNSYATHLAHEHHTLSHDDLNAFIDENSRSRAHLCNMHGRCRREYPDSKYASHLLCAIKSLIELMDKNGGIASLLTACCQGRNNGADPCSRGDYCEPPSHDTGCCGCPNCTPARGPCASECPPRDTFHRSERCHPSDGGRSYGYRGCTPFDHKECTPAPEAYGECGHCGRCDSDNHRDRRYERCGPHPDAVSANEHTQRLRHKHSVGPCCCCEGPGTATRR